MGARLDRLEVIRLIEMGREAESFYDETARVIVDRLKAKDPEVKDIIRPGAHRRYLSRTIAARIGELIVGGLIYGHLPLESGSGTDYEIFINYVCTSTGHEGRGVGRALIGEVEQVAREINISTLRLKTFTPKTGESDLVHWYSNLGFGVTGYQDSPDLRKSLVVLQKQL